ncbi:hypothetical protein ABW21_db0206845 [Orbilia brochopaga]|nr:hypothetical protein ABW21_db0206845 [Drechslerella brochopaga]
MAVAVARGLREATDFEQFELEAGRDAVPHEVRDEPCDVLAVEVEGAALAAVVLHVRRIAGAGDNAGGRQCVLERGGDGPGGIWVHVPLAGLAEGRLQPFEQVPGGLCELQLVELVGIIVKQVERGHKGVRGGCDGGDGDGAEAFKLRGWAGADKKPPFLHAVLEHLDVCRDPAGGVSGSCEGMRGVQPAQEVPCLGELVLGGEESDVVVEDLDGGRYLGARPRLPYGGRQLRCLGITRHADGMM